MTKQILVQQIQTAPDHRLYNYCDLVCFKVSKLRNKSLYELRQIYFDNKDSNLNNLLTYPDLKKLFHLVKNTKEYQSLPAKVANGTIKALLAEWKGFRESNKSYWKWVKSKEERARHPNKFRGKPNPPGYKGTPQNRRADGRSVAHFDKQTMKNGSSKEKPIVSDGIINLCSNSSEFRLEVPFIIKEKVNSITGEIPIIDVREVRIIPCTGMYSIEVVYTETFEPVQTKKQQELQRTAAIDLGINNLAAMVTEGFKKPFVISGKKLKSINAFAYREIAKAKREIERCKSKEQKRLEKSIRLATKKIRTIQSKLDKLVPKPTKTRKRVKLCLEFKLKLAIKDKSKLYAPTPKYDPNITIEPISKVSKLSSEKIQLLWRKRDNRLEHYLHVASNLILQKAVRNGVTTLVIGRNKGWKQDKRMKNFVQIPLARLISILSYKSVKFGIEIVLQDESYTSKASAFDIDSLPERYLGKGKSPKFSGKRISRGLYKSSNGTVYNSDVNGALNILRKHRETVSQKWVTGVCSTPFVSTHLTVN